MTRSGNSLDRLVVRPVSFRDACAFIAAHHRHHKPPQGHKFSLSVHNAHLCGVACVGRPTARRMDDGMTAEVTRLCTDGTRNACSCLYAAARRVAKDMGYAHIVTYILASEDGTSLRAAGWVKECDTPGRSWSVPSRPRDDKHPIEPKHRWGAWLNGHSMASHGNDVRRLLSGGDTVCAMEARERRGLNTHNSPRDLRGDSRVTFHADVGCSHDWRESIDTQFCNETHTEVKCTKCGMVGEKTIATEEVFFPAT